MAEFKVVIGHPSGKCMQKQLSDQESKTLLGKDIGQTIKGENIGFTEYEFQITGGSDHAGIPMRSGIQGAGRKKILTKKSVGFSGKNRNKNLQSGLRKKIMICGNKVYPKISQVNLKVIKEGKEPLFEEAPKKESLAAKTEEKDSKETKEK